MPDAPLIQRQQDLAALCQKMASAPVIGFDTEFVPEHTYNPVLCLVQIATGDLQAAIDPLAVEDMTPFWELLSTPGRRVVAHAGQAELEFCMRAARRLPEDFFDIQLAAGFAGLGYPLSYTNLGRSLLGADDAPAGAARTDWRQRPLTDAQIRYAMHDVAHLLQASRSLEDRLRQQGRWSWFQDEGLRVREDLRRRASKAPWKRVSGAARLSRADTAVLVELAEWREDRAAQLDKPLKWIMRDDLLVELAKRKPRSADELANFRGLGHLGRQTRLVEDLLDAIEEGINTPPELWPSPRDRRRETPGEAAALKLMAAIMVYQADVHDIAPALLGTSKDLARLVAWYVDGADPRHTPRLLRGWRRELCGEMLLDFLRGNLRLGLGPQRPLGDLTLYPQEPV